jgi:CheY-like chemotaxis protein
VLHLPASSIVPVRKQRERLEHSAPAVAAGPRGKILVVDDNRDAADSLALVLGVFGHEVLVGHSSQDALEMGARERPDAIILDIGMPDMTGYEAARRIRREAWGRNVYLLAVTGWGQADDKENARAAGFDRHFTKPVDPDQVEALLTEFLKSRAAADALQRPTA